MLEKDEGQLDRSCEKWKSITYNEGERNILHTIKRWKAKWIGHILRRNCLLKHIIWINIEGRIDVTGKRGTSRKQLLDDLKEKRGYWKLKEEALDRNLWRTRFGRGYGPVVRQTAEWSKTVCRHVECRHFRFSAQPAQSKRSFFPQWRNSPYWATASSLSRLHDHTQTHHTR